MVSKLDFHVELCVLILDADRAFQLTPRTPVVDDVIVGRP